VTAPGATRASLVQLLQVYPISSRYPSEYERGMGTHSVPDLERSWNAPVTHPPHDFEPRSESLHIDQKGTHQARRRSPDTTHDTFGQYEAYSEIRESAPHKPLRRRGLYKLSTPWTERLEKSTSLYSIAVA